MASASGDDDTGLLIDIAEEKKQIKVYDEDVVLPPLPLTTGVPSCENLRADVTSEAKEHIPTIDNLLEADIKTLDQEEFDFDLAFSPDGSQEDTDEEVFIGPVGFTETCVSAAVETADSPQYKPLTPLKPEQFVELCKEANTLAYRISALSVSEQKRKPFPKVSLKDNIKKSTRKGNTDKATFEVGLGVPRLKLDFTSPEPKLDVDIKVFSDRLPKADLPQSPEGVKIFSAKKSNKKSDTSNKEKPSLAKTGSKLAPPRRGGLQKPRSGIGRAPSLREPKRYSPVKRQRTNSVGSDVETSSVASDVSTSSSLSTGLPVPGKRHIPSPRFKPKVTKKAAESTKKAEKTAAIQSTLKRSSLLKPSAMQNKPVLPNKVGQQKPTTNNTRNGPMKATVPAAKTTVKKQPSFKDKNVKSSGYGQQGKENKPKPMNPPAGCAPSRNSSVESLDTPRKAEKNIKPKNLLQNSCTPVKKKPSSSVSSDITTPASSKRKSLLPTPMRSASSTGSKSPPSIRRTPSMNRTHGVVPVMKLVDIEPTEPVETNGKAPLVQNTPQLQKTARKPSIWSPVVRQKPMQEDEYIVCTKRTSIPKT